MILTRRTYLGLCGITTVRIGNLINIKLSTGIRGTTTVVNIAPISQKTITWLHKLSDQPELGVKNARIIHEESIDPEEDTITARLLLKSSPSVRENLDHVKPIITANFQCSAFKCRMCYHLPSVKARHAERQ